MATQPPASAIRRRACFTLWFVNFVLGVLVGANYLAHVPEVNGFKLWLFAVAALVSSVLMLTLLPGAFFYAAAHWVRSIHLLGASQAAFWTLFQILLFVDTRIYNLFRYHFNGQVLNLMYTRGSDDAVHLGWQVWLTISVCLLAFIVLQTVAWKKALNAAQRYFEHGPHYLLLRPLIIWGILLPTVFVEKTIYAQADLARDRQITHLARLFPLYARVPLEDLASKVLGVRHGIPAPPELESIGLSYPKAIPVLDDQAARPNILILAIDCWRQDMLTQEETPRLFAWAKDGVRGFKDHVSGGNSTRYGVFSMLYGLYGSYWPPVLKEKRSPVLVDMLLEAGYEFGVFGSASMDYPELRDTVWVRVKEQVRHEFDSPLPWRRDELAADALIDWLDERDGPFFGFLLLDSPHQTYSHPPDKQPFLPSASELDYVAITRNEGPSPDLLRALFNRYRNAIYHADDVAGGVLEHFSRSPLYDDTIIIVTGDHGEEFLECGFFGHTSAFTPPQVRVPMLVRGPGFAPGCEDRPTSHLDIPATLLELLGAHPSIRPHWTLGQNLLTPVEGRKRVISGWNELGLWTPEGIIRVPLSILEFDVELYDYEWRIKHDDLSALLAEREALERLGAECNRFLR